MGSCFADMQEVLVGMVPSRYENLLEQSYLYVFNFHRYIFLSYLINDMLYLSHHSRFLSRYQMVLMVLSAYQYFFLFIM